MSDDDLIRRGNAKALCDKYTYVEGVKYWLDDVPAVPLDEVIRGLVERATAALDGVTPGPWAAYGENSVPEVHRLGVAGPADQHGRIRDICGLDMSAGKDRPESVSNARFVAAARQLVPDLTAALEAQARQIADLTAQREQAGIVGMTNKLFNKQVDK